MLSILIPTYNYDITKLVDDLHQQAVLLSVDFEIIVMEDGSTLYTNQNRVVEQLEFCRYIPLATNVGRSAIRNKLADAASYHHLLFMDCDAEVCSDQFVANYLTYCKGDCIVIGGTAYDPNESNPLYSLRLAYGRMREARTALQRNQKNTYHNFMTFNFLISKALFNQIRFDETIRGYGHEDTVFGHQLHELGYKPIHIENPLIHKGLDENQIFIRKIEEGSYNLYLLYKSGKYPFLATDSKLLNTFVSMNKLKLTPILRLIFLITQKSMRKLLYKQSPSLRLFDVYKILYLCKASLDKR